LALLATSTAWTWCAWRYFGEAVSRSERHNLRALFWASDLPAMTCGGATTVLTLCVAIYLFTKRHPGLGSLLFLYGTAIVIAIAFVSGLPVPFKPPGL